MLQPAVHDPSYAPIAPPPRRWRDTPRREIDRPRSREAQRERIAFDETPVGSILIGREGRIERVNESICRITGRTTRELLAMSFVELAHPDDRTAGAAILDAMFRSAPSTRRFEIRCLHRSGRVIEGYIALTSILDEEDEVAELFGQIEDITDARRTTRELEEAQVEMLARLAAAAEFHDDDTGQHTRRVGDLSVAIASRLGLPGSEIELLRIAAPLHDIGKIATPDAVLSKPTVLTAEEFEEMKAHTTIGAQMLAGSAFALLEMAEQIALTHHERWDGSGYPAGLAGRAIPLAGRIVAVADVFDALTHARPYKPAWSVGDAIDDMTSEAGRHFDPEVLEAFLRHQRNPTATPGPPLKVTRPMVDATCNGVLSLTPLVGPSTERAAPLLIL
jgi:PAS domain S-box-containing protein/putative nucleotidyltransferase with HDIG domain